MLNFKYQEKSITGMELAIFLILQTIFKVIVGLISFYLLSWLFKEIELKTILFLTYAWIIAWNSKLTFRNNS